MKLLNSAPAAAPPRPAPLASMLCMWWPSYSSRLPLPTTAEPNFIGFCSCDEINHLSSTRWPMTSSFHSMSVQTHSLSRCSPSSLSKGSAFFVFKGSLWVHQQRIKPTDNCHQVWMEVGLGSCLLRSVLWWLRGFILPQLGQILVYHSLKCSRTNQMDRWDTLKPLWHLDR